MSTSSFIRVLFIFLFIMYFLVQIIAISGLPMWLLAIPAIVLIGDTIIYLKLYRTMTIAQQKKSINMLVNAGCIYLLAIVILSTLGMISPYKNRLENREYTKLILSMVNLLTIPLFALFIFLSTLGAKVTTFKSQAYNVSFLRLYRFILVMSALFVGGGVYSLLQMTTCTFGLTDCL